MSEVNIENDLSEESAEKASSAAETPDPEAEPTSGQVTEKTPEQASEETHTYGELIKGFIKWFIIAVIIGVIVGLAGTAFTKALGFANNFRNNNSWTVFIMPLAGLVIVFLYTICGLSKDPGTNNIIKGARADEEVSIKLAPLIFIATFLTHITGGSAGREGAALQIGGSLASPFGKLFRLDKKDFSTLIMCGMAAGFSALFGTPIAAAVFAVEVTIVAAAQYSALVPCMVSSLTAVVTAKLFGVEPEAFHVAGVPSLGGGSAVDLLKVALLGAACAALSVLFCFIMHNVGHLYKKYIKNDYIRAAAGGVIIILLTLIVGNRDYNGAGMNIIEKAFEGEAFPLAFLLKILFTALTLGAGFKGGEIVPSFFAGAAFGCVFGGLIGLDPSFGAAVGLLAVFCGVTNCPFASIILSLELFGKTEGLAFYALAISISYMLSGYWGLYSAQKFYQSKLKPMKYFERKKS
ncbi:MAG: chloride channel protein [Oscillospiraceae bacterium]|nr:chloride channel protein [Oscillospiraceae bacterium]